MVVIINIGRILWFDSFEQYEVRITSSVRLRSLLVLDFVCQICKDSELKNLVHYSVYRF